MPTHIAKSRKKLKAKEAEEDAVFLGEMGFKPKKVEGTDETEQESGRTINEPSNDGAKMGNKGSPEKARSEQGREEAAVGGFVEVDTEQNARDRKRKLEQEAAGKQRIELLNEWADNILNCLDPEAKQNFHTAAFDAKVLDIGLYILGILNRMHKMGDYFEPDIEFEWEQGQIGHNQDLFCEYCQEKINRPLHLNQRFCSNKCARNYKLQNTTGVIYPKTDAEQFGLKDPEEKAWELEQKRVGATA